MPVAEKKPEPEAKPVAIQAVAKQEPKEAAAPAASGTQAAAKAGQTIRVDLEKLDRLVNTVGELVITQAMLARSEEHTSELQSLMRISYAVFCLKKKKRQIT